MSKRYTTNFLVDTNGNTGSEGQVLVSTSTGVNWSDGSDISGGPYLPLSAGSTFPLTGDLYLGGFNKISGVASDNLVIGVDINNVSGSSSIDFQLDGSTSALFIDNSRNVTLSGTLAVSGSGDSYFTGDLGIGVTSPVKKLQVSSSAIGDLINILCVNTHDTNGDTAGIGFSMTNTNSFNKAAIYFERTSGQGIGDLHFAVNNTVSSVNVTKADARLTIKPTGNVGIGTASPVAKLEVSSSSQTGLISTRISNSFGSTTSDGAGTSLEFFGWDAGVTAEIKSIRAGQSYSPSALTFETFGGNNTSGSNTLAERMRIDGYGNVGIGTTSPSQKLQVDGNIAFSQGGEIMGQINTELERLDFKVQDGVSAATAVAMTLRDYSSGPRLGLGTTSPSEKLEVKGNLFLSNDNSKIAINQNLAGTPSYGYSDGNNGPGQIVVAGYASSSQFPGIMTLMNRDSSITANQDLGVIQFVGKDDATNGYASSQIIGTSNTGAGTGNSGGGILRFLTSNGSTLSERMRIRNDGRVGIGVTSPQATLDVSGNFRLQSGGSTYLSIGSYSGSPWINTGTSGGTVQFGAPTSNTTNISVQGTATATNFILSSDKRLKENIKTLNPKKIDIKWKSFNLKTDNNYRTGVIAQELETEHPEFVRTDKEGLKSVAYIDLLIAKIAELEARLEKAGI